VKVDGELRLLEEAIELDKKFKHDISVVVDRLVMQRDRRKRLADSVETAVALADGILEVETLPRDGSEPELRTFSERFACLHCGISMPELEPRMFSFNSPHGACPRCTGLGTQMEIDPDLVVPDPSLTLGEGRGAALVERLVGATTSRSPRPSPTATRSTSRRRGRTCRPTPRTSSCTGRTGTRSTSPTATGWAGGGPT
jgi:excinuclease UvrABC ATPase subunit